MIVRYFTAEAAPVRAPEYFAFLRNVVLPKLEAIPGHCGALVLSNERDRRINITVLTFWESDEAIRLFAGDDAAQSVVEPEARAILSAFSDRVTRMTVEVNTLGFQHLDRD
jgi:heme-degrading monooxygenase HmoA